MRPSPQVAAQIEALLREQLAELGEDVDQLAPHSITRLMQCEVHPDGSLIYAWKEIPILRVVPEEDEEGVTWRMFTREETPRQ